MDGFLAQARSLLQAGSPELSLLEAKNALAASGRRDPRPWLAMSKALVAMREPERAYTTVARARQELGPSHKALQHEQGALLEALASGSSRAMDARRLRCWKLRHEPPPFDRPRVFCISDLHVDQGGNMHALNRISTSAFQGDVLIVAGDVADSMSGVRHALELLRSRFSRVVFVAGNHDLWLRPGLSDGSSHPDSVAKLLALMTMCDELDVDTMPVQVVPNVVIVPLNSWYHWSFDVADPRPGRLRFDSFCRWPVDDLDMWQLMLALNRPALACVAAHTHSQAAAAAGPTAGGGGGGKRVTAQGQAAATASVGGGGKRVTAQGQAAAHGNAITGAGGISLPSQSQVAMGRERGQPLQGQGQAPAAPPSATAGGGAAAKPEPVRDGDSSKGVSITLPAATAAVITASHFLPSPALPFHSMSPELGKAVGCLQLAQQLDVVGSQVHVYGHTHVRADMQLPVGDQQQRTRHHHGSGAASALAGTATVMNGSSAAPGRGGAAAGGAMMIRRHVHNPLDGVRQPCLVCVWDMSDGVGARYSVSLEGNVCTPQTWA